MTQLNEDKMNSTKIWTFKKLCFQVRYTKFKFRMSVVLLCMFVKC